MKKVFKCIIALCCAMCCLLGIVACDTVKGNSKVKSVTVTLNVNGNKEDFNFDLYLNYAPGTIEHFTYLAEQGYYDNTAVSNVDGHVEFGAYYFVDGLLKSKYDKDAEKSYYSIITETYAKGKTIGPADYARYTGDLKVNGEFNSNGFKGNSLTLSGSLVLKRDVDSETPAAAYDSGLGTMAITFGSDDYFTGSGEFAIIGSISSNDAKGDVKSSFDRLKALMEKYDKDDNDNVYYYYSYESGERKDEYGNYFMYSADDGAYFAKDGNGEYTVELERDEDDEDAPVNVLLDEFAKYDDYMHNLPYGENVITVEKITFGK